VSRLNPIVKVGRKACCFCFLSLLHPTRLPFPVFFFKFPSPATQGEEEEEEEEEEEAEEKRKKGEGRKELRTFPPPSPLIGR